MNNFMEGGNLVKKEGGKFPTLDEQEGNLGDDEEIGVVEKKGIKIEEERKIKDQQDIDNSYQ